MWVSFRLLRGHLVLCIFILAVASTLRGPSLSPSPCLEWQPPDIDAPSCRVGVGLSPQGTFLAHANPAGGVRLLSQEEKAGKGWGGWRAGSTLKGP